MEVVAIPLDSIVKITAESKGLTVLAPDFELAAKQLEGQRFDCILILDILQQLPDPPAIVRLFRRFLRNDGTVLVSVPNWNYLGTVRQRLTSQGRQLLQYRATPQTLGVHRTTKSCVVGWLRQSGLHQIQPYWVAAERWRNIRRWALSLADEYLCRNLLVAAKR